MDNASIINASYIVASLLFIFGLKKMTHPRTAMLGNCLGAAGMGLAVIVTIILHNQIEGYVFILLGVIIGGAVGLVLAIKIQMTAMPQLVAIFNGFGGAASIFVAGAEIFKGEMTRADELIASAAAGIIGSVTFSGSVIAFAKLQEIKQFKNPIPIPSGKWLNAALAALILALAIGMVYSATPGSLQVSLYVVIVLLAAALGFLLVNSIGGADMPVVIALLNSYSGLAAAATGFVLPNNILIIAGSLVGASGVILCQLMCKAMNRSLANVLFGGMGTSGPAGDADEIYSTVRSTSPEDVAMILESAQRVVFVPGYGMAVAQAQHAVHDLGKLLEEHQIEVEYAIHPVAGRMPGHMNVLLAEADVSYEKLKEMDEINQTIGQVDVAIVIGANDTVNPDARNDPQSVIAGMPIVDVDKARTVIVIKRSLSAGFAGIPNPLFAAENTLMLFGDGKQAVLDILSAAKEDW